MIHSKGKPLLWLGVLVLLLAPLTLQATPAAADGWVIECVDCPKYFTDMTDRSLRLDAEEFPHIAYGGDHLYYAWHDGVSWHYETVDDSPGVGRYASLALDGDGYPHISYYDDTNGDLKYAYQDASGWHIETVAAELRHFGINTSLGLDREGYPHISYLDWDNDDLMYAYQDASGWHIQTVDSLRYVGWYNITSTSLVLDGDGYPHISYFPPYYYSNSLQYAYQNASGWHIKTVDSEGDVGEYSSLALDGSGYPHISYRDESNRDLKYAYYPYHVYLPIMLKE